MSAVHYPGLASHAEHARARTLFRDYGALLSFELVDGVDPFAVLNRLAVVVLSSNLGDNRTLAIPVAQTIFWEMGRARREAMGIAESLVRVSVGIEDEPDLIRTRGRFGPGLELPPPHPRRRSRATGRARASLVAQHVTLAPATVDVDDVRAAGACARARAGTRRRLERLCDRAGVDVMIVSLLPIVASRCSPAQPGGERAADRPRR